jgi:DNA-directed RNA polymerase I subunit RPA2
MNESGDKVLVDCFGEELQAAGYNYYGSEPLYSGVSGCLMQADLYIGVVYYQRLRHMVSDKYQVRSKAERRAAVSV